ncbi:DeoR/GlpR family DNA-binding transcription regulator, partial [Mangrovactinospora gilvigrisea]|uniref:DeoR/GlpR family DNA-binding transcription regulator n=1 Tax=Mangrovactinospora gilvigrisea TaxID=1428644 RepID=UPI000A577468
MAEGRALARQRQAEILEEARRRGSVRVGELTSRFRVSDMTVRRDLAELASRGLLEKVHGGAVLGSAVVEPGFTAKRGWEADAKERIARAAVALIRPGSAVGLSAGTTTFALARELAAVAASGGVVAGLTVVTNSPPAAEVLEGAGLVGLTVILVGGLRTPSGALVGPVA